MFFNRFNGLIFSAFLVSLIAFFFVHIGDHNKGFLTKDHLIKTISKTNDTTYQVSFKIKDEHPFDRVSLCSAPQPIKVFPQKLLDFFEGTRLAYWLENRVSKRFPQLRVFILDCLDQDEVKIKVYGNQADITMMNGQELSNEGKNLTLSRAHPSYNWASPLTKAALFLTSVLSLIALLKSRDFLKTATYSTLTTAFTILIFFAGLEVYLRFEIPFTERNITRNYFPEFGFHYQPNTTYESTNHTDFWTIQKSNSYGFLDREPVVPKPEGRFRILLVGDSFVEAQQVNMDDKLQRRLEHHLKNAFPEKDIDVVAIGSNGTGQSNQLRFYEHFQAAFKPDLVLLLAVGNDLANNSSLLTSLEFGWDPYHPPLLYFEDGKRLGPDPDWAKYIIRVDQRLPRSDRLLAFYEETINRFPEVKERLGEWKPVYDDNVHNMFFVKDVPDVFLDALKSTESALNAFKEQTKANGQKLFVVAIDDLSRNSLSSAKGRVMDPKLYINRFAEINHKLGIPFLDLFPYIDEKGLKRKIRFLFDGHWNALGHDIGAQLITDYLKDHPDLLIKVKN